MGGEIISPLPSLLTLNRKAKMTSDNHRMQGITINHVKLSCDLQNAIAEYQDMQEGFDSGSYSRDDMSTAIDNLRTAFSLWSDTGNALNDYCNAVLFNR